MNGLIVKLRSFKPVSWIDYELVCVLGGVFGGMADVVFCAVLMIKLIQVMLSVRA